MRLRYQDFLEEKKDLIGLLLDSFDIKYKYINKYKKGFVDVYDICPVFGTKISKLNGLLDELGMYLRSFDAPSGYVVPSEGVYRVEIQTEPIVSKELEDLFCLDIGDKVIPTCIGTTSSGLDLFIDLNCIPNLLIGGTTGSGKSVLLHNIILSQINFGSDLYLVDPKYVEFSMYKNFLGVSKIDNSVEEFKITLLELFEKMNYRYNLMKKFKARNIKEYNNNINVKNKFSPIVIVIDEWADLCLQDKKLQDNLCLIAQKGRAAGISIVLATQRPSVNVISGLIKANFPGRICLRVASSVDSKVIIDTAGGETLTETGCGLYLDGSLKKPVKFKTPYISNIDIFLRGLKWKLLTR